MMQVQKIVLERFALSLKLSEIIVKKIPQEVHLSVDEMMVPYKGKKAGNLRQYLNKKPKKWGFKFFVLSGVSGMVYDFLCTREDQHMMEFSFPI